jgi:hypothetical protein
MKKTLMVIAVMACMAFSSVQGKLFSDSETSVSLGGVYSDTRGGQDFAPVVGLSLFVTPHFGVRASTALNVEGYKTLNNAEVVGLARCAVYKFVSVYAGAGASYNSSEQDKWCPTVLAGSEVKLGERLSVFAEEAYVDSRTRRNFDDWQTRVGFRWTF